MSIRRRDDPADFDAAYYDRFYGAQAVHDADRITHLAAAVHHLAEWWQVRIHSVLDVGAGTGLWRDWYRTTHPHVRVRSVDVSPYACKTFGHERRNISEWRPSGRFDLVVCHSVLQYMDDEHAARAVDHVGAATRYLLYLEVPTTDDLSTFVDPCRTDMHVYQRSGAWYRHHLDPHLRQVGAGLWAPRDAVPLFELEAAGD